MDYKKMMEDRNAINRFPVSNGIKVVEMAEGYAKSVLNVSEYHTNPVGSIHGGCLFTLADAAASAAAASFGDKITTVDASVHYLRPALKLDQIYAEAQVIKRGHRLITVDVTVKCGIDVVLSKVMFTCMPLK